MARRRVLLLANSSRSKVRSVLTELKAALSARIEIVQEVDADGGALPHEPAAREAELAIAIGGDGTLIGQARRLAAAGLDLPIIGVNIGRLGVLAEFDPQSLLEHADVIFGQGPPIQEHMMLSVRIEDASGKEIDNGLALNDGVITAGEPFRMIEMSFEIDGSEGPTLNGDGVVIATPVGSTAYNVSAGGPIVHPALEAMTITPLAAHSLAFRPIVVDGSSVIQATIERANRGTALVKDGQDATALKVGYRATFARHPKKTRLVVNPATTYWSILLDKLRWAAPPTYRERGV